MKHRSIRVFSIHFVVAVLLLGGIEQVGADVPAQLPLFVGQAVPPKVMINMSKDHQLFYKAFDDYSDLNNDGSPDTTYNHNIDYYGYFDSYKCYTYGSAAATNNDTATASHFTTTTTTTTTTTGTAPTYACGNSPSASSFQSCTPGTTIRCPISGGSSPYTRTCPSPSSPSISSASSNGLTTTDDSISSSTATSVPVSWFVPVSVTTDKYCASGTNQWSGNFLNWATMARMDVVRKTLYGGYRYLDPVSNAITSVNSTLPVTSSTTEPTEPTDPVNVGGYPLVVNTPYNTSSSSTQKWMTIRTTSTRTSSSTSTTTTNTSTSRVTSYPTPTVLERTYIPTDAHSWAKFYSGTDLNRLTPYSHDDGITLCNTTEVASGNSQSVSAPPLIRVAKGNYALWAANERWQCRWGTGSNSNDAAKSGLAANSSSPSSGANGSAEFIARVAVCASVDLQGKEKCTTYSNGNLKPTGLLQTYGVDGNIKFGLISGSYKKNKSGGVLRKNIGSIANEINTDGTFVSPAPSAGSIINTINKLRLVGYNHADGLYNNADACSWGVASFNNNNCRNWGNPQAEMYLESLRYFAGKGTASTTFNTTEDVLPLTTASPFTDPIGTNEYCGALNILQFNASTTSFDADELSDVSGLAGSISALDGYTDAVGAGEPLSGNFFVGENGSDNNQLCTAKAVNPTGSNTLSKIRGTCPDAPRLSGSYQIAGLANFAHTTDLRSTLENNQTVKTYGIALSPAIPRVTIPVPSSSGKTVTILPACRNASTTPQTNCAIVDFKIVQQSATSTAATGKLYVNWEDSEQGGDYDQDQWGILEYTVTNSTVTIKTTAVAQSTPYLMGFGYVISGTTKDGFHVHSGINGFSYTDTSGVAGCSNCQVTDAASTRTYTIGASTAKNLEQPLYYAAKWGGFLDSNKNNKPDLQSEWDTKNNVTGTAIPDGIPDNYFAATNPAALESSLATAFEAIQLGDGSASAVATNSTRLDNGTLLYQAKFNPADWSGEVVAYALGTKGELTENWKTSDLGHFTDFANRKIFTLNPNNAVGSRGTPLLWENLTCPGPVSASCKNENLVTAGTSQQDYLNKLPPSTTSDGFGAGRVDWLRGDHTNEKLSTTDNNPAHIFRKRNKLLGDTVNSDPIFVGTQDYGHASLSGVEGTSYAAFRASPNYLTRRPMLYIGANDGMLHGFDARKNAGATTTGGDEVFAYIPNFLFPELSKLTSPSYDHQYYVDGVGTSGDVYDSSVAQSWRSLVVGALGAGGRAIFALDVTDPETFGAANVLWEFSNKESADLGYTLAEPTIARLEDGHWVVILANGYHSDNGKAVLFILDALTGTVLQKIDTGVGPSTPPGRADKNGLSSPLPVDSDGNGSIDKIYAGDLYGNLWKFDVSGAVGSYPVPTAPFFVACASGLGTSCSTADRQPITGRPSVGSVQGTGTDQNGVGRMIYVGTGKFFEVGDNIVPSSPQLQSIYGLWDTDMSSLNRSLLQEQSIDYEGVAKVNCGLSTCQDLPNKIRVVSSNPVCYAATSTGCTASSILKKGWVLNLVAKPDLIATSERIVSYPIVFADLVIFDTVIPNPDACSSGGKSFHMEIDALTGAAFSEPPFDTNRDSALNGKDYVFVNGAKVIASGIDIGIGIVKRSAIVSGFTNPDDPDNITTGTNGSVAPSLAARGLSGSTSRTGIIIGRDKQSKVTEAPVGTSGRKSWRQLNTWED